ncbi:acyl-CoA dehydrogenase family member 10 isoform 2-T3 [Lycaon pictus]
MYIRQLFQSSHLQWAWRAAFLEHIQGRHQRARRWAHSGGGTYKAVIFDMGGVLIPSLGRVAAEWELQNHILPGTIQKAWILGGENGPWIKFMRGAITTEDFLQEFGRLCSEISKTSVPVGSFLSLLTSEQVAKQFPVMTNAITQIRAKGLRTAVLSNNFYLPNGKSFLPLDRKQFDVVVESCLEGVCKPDPRIYRLCLERLGLQPSESIFLDDLGPNLKAAASLGIHTIQVNDPETAIKELEALLGFTLRMVIPNTCPVRKTVEIPRDSLEKYLKDLLGTQSTGPLELLQFEQGQSNPTYYVRLANHQLVLRRKPPGTLVPSTHALEREFRTMKALANAGVPVPKVLDLCKDSWLDNLVFHPEKAEVLAVLHWEFSTVGDPLVDVACSCLAHYLPSSSPTSLLRGLSDCDFTQLGIPTAEEYLRMYCLHSEIPPPENWNFYMAFSFFRMAAVVQGIYKHSLTEQASSAATKQNEKLIEYMSNLAWDFAVKEGFRVFKEMPATKPPMRI